MWPVAEKAAVELPLITAMIMVLPVPMLPWIKLPIFMAIQRPILVITVAARPRLNIIIAIPILFFCRSILVKPFVALLERQNLPAAHKNLGQNR